MHELVLPCKPYVRRFLTNQCGTPVDLRKNRYIFNYFKLLLKRKICWRNKRFHLKEYAKIAYEKNGKTLYKQYGKAIYKDEVKIMIDDDTFNRFGFDMTAHSIGEFNAFMEDYIKSMARLFIFTTNSFGQTWVNSIKNFQDLFGFSEDDFPTESIRKDLQRHNDILKNIEKTFGQSVPNFGQSVPNAS